MSGPDVARYVAEKGGNVAVHDLTRDETLIASANVDGEVSFARIPGEDEYAKNNVEVWWERPRDDRTYLVWVIEGGSQ